MSVSHKALFLSYASEDGPAARRLADGLRAAGLEVWFDQAELRGGDAWDHLIRRQIKDCALFLPLISASTQQRREGYFRREWRLAAERTHDMAAGTAFLLPVVIDGTADHEAVVPEEFIQVQWTRLPAGVPASDFTARIVSLLAVPPVRAATPDGTPRPALAAPEDRSVAVLAFANMSQDRENEYFSDGISEELIHVLSRLPHWRVAARTSAFFFKGRNLPVPQIARELKVAYVVEGSVRRIGARARVTAQLVEARTGFHVWSQSFDREVTDLFALQDELAHAIMLELRAALPGGPEAAPYHAIASALQARSADRSSNAEAFRLYLQARYFLLRSNIEDNERSRTLFAEALALDPAFALAWAGRSQACSAAADLGLLPFAAGYAEARTAAERALALSADLPEGVAAWVKVALSHDWDWAGARQALAAARARHPENVDLLNCAVLLAKFTGGRTEAIQLGRQAVAADPLNVQSRVRLAGAYFEADRLPEAEAEVRRAIELSPSSDFALYYLFVIALRLGRVEEAAAAAAREQDPDFRRFFQVLLAVARGRADDAAAQVHELEQQSRETMAYQIALAHAYRGDGDAAFAWLELAFAQRDPGMARLKNDPFLAPLHADPRWPALLARLRL